MEDRSNAPAPEELLELVEKQDMMIDCLLQKLEMCQDQIRLFREADVKRQEAENEANTLVKSAQQKVTSTLAAVEQLQDEKERLERELDDMRAKNEEKPVDSIIQLRNRIKELEFELLREQRSSGSLQRDLEFQKSRADQMQNEIDESNNSKKSMIASLSSKMEDTVKEMAELRIKYQSLLDDRERIESELGSELQVVNQRCGHLQAHCDRLSDEVAKLRKECKVAEYRLATLVEENAVLRGKVRSL
ncbi:hypothetical protein Y032_0231g2992 [Ancylostoma ceylanicum]|uniref:Uncharacterized protein n=1 Tax=Ancylostoma ceylanicum TaxID=53326 RepID=A0A016SGJ4_9BILA|nr:hypothetical protein Y032_0231g2992 [Ancylostoma ceylanicum]